MVISFITCISNLSNEISSFISKNIYKIVPMIIFYEYSIAPWCVISLSKGFFFKSFTMNT